MRRICWVACLAFVAHPVWGDGFFAGGEWTSGEAEESGVGERVVGRDRVASTEQKGVIIELLEGREALLLQTTYHGPADRFAWIIPVPGKPARDDVFLASPAFIDELIRHTAPEVQTTITDPRVRGRPGKGELEEEEEGEEALAPELGPTVTVHERMAVGDFDVAVLSATGPEVLTNWLRENRFAIPDDSEDMLGHYVQKRWYFVALRMQPGKVEERPVLQDVDPIGIRFDAEKLVYPLYISRASSRQKTALLLIVLSNGPVACDRLSEAKLPLDKRLPKGACYAAIRREAIEGKPQSAVCEFVGPEGMPYADLHYEKDRFSGPEGAQWSPGYLWTTRLWTMLDLQDLEDLTFSPSPDRKTMKLVVLRNGELRPSGRQWVSSALATIRHRARRQSRTGGLTWFYGAAGAALFICALWAANRGLRLLPRYIWWALFATLLLAALSAAFSPVAARAWVLVGCLLALTITVGERAVRDDRPPKLSAGDALTGALIAAGLGAFAHVAYCLLVGGGDFLRRNADGMQVLDYWRGAAPVPYLLLATLGQLLWLALVIGFLRRGLKGTGPKARWLLLPLFCLAVVVVVELSRGYLVDDLRSELAGLYVPGVGVLLGTSALTLAALALLLAFVTTASLIGANARRTAAPMARALVALLLVAVIASVVGMTSAQAGTGGYIASGVRELDTALARLDDALTSFLARHGCYPATLQDLIASNPPAAGLDSSGNRVTITAQPGGGPLLTELPVDPLSGRNDTWLYEPTGSPMIDSGGYEIRIEAQPLAAGS